MKQDIYIFCKAEVVQYAIMDRDKGPPAMALLAARGEANARRVMEDTTGVTAMVIASVNGEMLERHIDLAVKDGCEGSWMREDEGWRWYSWSDRPKPPPTRLTDAEVRTIGTDCQLTQQIERSDIIAAVNVVTKEEVILWRKPGMLKYAHRQARIFEQAGVTETQSGYRPAQERRSTTESLGGKSQTCAAPGSAWLPILCQSLRGQF